MRAKLIVRAMTLLLVMPILILVQAPNGSANAESGYAGESPTASSCAGKTYAIPTTIFTRVKTHPNGRFSGFEIHLSSGDRVCSTILYAFTIANR